MKECTDERNKLSAHINININAIMLTKKIMEYIFWGPPMTLQIKPVRHILK